MSEQVSTLIDEHPVLGKWNIFLAGAGAGLLVDVSLYPVDTIKSRLQSEAGFIKSGGFTKLYKGLPPVVAGSIPSSSLFFLTYETTKEKLRDKRSKIFGPSSSSDRGDYVFFEHIFAASIGEVVACTARVPTEVVKVRSQTRSGKSNLAIALDIVKKEGPMGLYRGFVSTVIRDTPFSAIQFPIWEGLKKAHTSRNGSIPNIYQSAFYGSIAGGIAAFVTTPLDVAKTRIMLANQKDSLSSGRISDAIKVIYLESGLRGCFAGLVPRMVWISIGAAIWLGTYEKILDMQMK